MSRDDDAMSESFFLSNMCPQEGSLNSGKWSVLEARIRDWVRERGRLWIITGPIFTAGPQWERHRVIGDDHVAVPPAFYKIVVDARQGRTPEVLAFWMPNQGLTGHDLEEYLRSVDEIERATGLDFLSGLPQEVQARVEGEAAEALW